MLYSPINYDSKVVFSEVLKSLLRTNVLNDVTAAKFSVSFFQLSAVENIENSAAVTSLRTFICSSDFRSTKYLSNLRLQKCIYSSKKARSDISNSQAH